MTELLACQPVPVEQVATFGADVGERSEWPEEYTMRLTFGSTLSAAAPAAVSDEARMTVERVMVRTLLRQAKEKRVTYHRLSQAQVPNTRDALAPFLDSSAVPVLDHSVGPSIAVRRGTDESHRGIHSAPYGSTDALETRGST